MRSKKSITSSFFLLFILILVVYFSLRTNSNETFTDRLVLNQENKTKIGENNKEKNIKASFVETFLKFPLNETKVAFAENNPTKIDEFTTDMIKLLVEFDVKEPLVKINEECLPPPLEEVNCGEYPGVFSGKRERPAKIAHLIQFGFDVDTLEIALHQYYDHVDFVFLLESIKTHYHQLNKPLVWEKVKHSERFSKFKHKVVHFVVDEALIGKMKEEKKGDWFLEELQEEYRWKKFLQWNEITKYFNDDDIIGFGDTDEIPSRKNLNLLKFCKLKVPRVDVGIWFPMGKVDQAFKPDWPVSWSHPYTLGDPTYYSLGAAKAFNENNKIPTRSRGRSGAFILGGMHMSHDGYLPFQMLKRLSCTECGININDFEHWYDMLSKGKLHELEFELAKEYPGNEKRIVPLSSLNDQNRKAVSIPWFYECNKQRFPQWERKHDTRLD
ncbi:hypothetical protein O9G_001407 [Rozella allomycis CSF55]|uniref:Uncharacterized protein n=1 Tax=Rozella allomycis (strain CSF55) TaxID=988480 RepID=A0A075B3J5_ROZAC|nr:hypothetical protein O9G_001407 [Rozella allomycis CSF55]|eukprot:EPZ36962.1 hypothetical protein O9G_001407 [Rozella allomycis CSF55]